MNWRQIVEKTNEEKYVLPPGWDAKDKIAKELDCSEERVNILLAPALKARRIEMKVFPVWDRLTRRVLRVTAYRQLDKK